MPDENSARVAPVYRSIPNCRAHHNIPGTPEYMVCVACSHIKSFSSAGRHAANLLPVLILHRKRCASSVVTRLPTQETPHRHAVTGVDNVISCHRTGNDRDITGSDRRNIRTHAIQMHGKTQRTGNYCCQYKIAIYED